MAIPIENLSPEQQQAVTTAIGIKTIGDGELRARIPAPGSPYQRSTVGTIADIDTTGHQGVLITTSGTFAGAAIAYQVSADGSNWATVNGQPIAGDVTIGTTSGVGTFVVPTYGLRFRMQLNAIASGTVNASIVMLAEYSAPVSAAVCSMGPVPHDNPVYGNPNRIGGRARNSQIAAVAENDVCDLIQTLAGALLVRPYSLPSEEWSYAAASGGITNTTAAVAVKAAAAAGIRNYVTAMTIFSEALGTATELVLRDGASGTVLWRTKIPTSGMPLTQITFPNPLKSTEATLLEAATLTASVTGAVYINLTGYTAP